MHVYYNICRICILPMNVYILHCIRIYVHGYSNKLTLIKIESPLRINNNYFVCNVQLIGRHKLNMIL